MPALPPPHPPLTDVRLSVEYSYRFRHFPNRTAFIDKANFYTTMQSPSKSPYSIKTYYTSAPNLKMAISETWGYRSFTRRNYASGQLIHRVFCSRFPNTVKGLAITSSFFYGAFAKLCKATITFKCVRPSVRMVQLGEFS